MQSMFKKIIRVLIFTALVSCEVIAQDSAHAYKEWITGAIGLGPPFESPKLEKVSFGLTYNFGWHMFFYQAGYNLIRQLLSGRGIYKEESFNLGLGARKGGKWTHVAFFTGPSVIKVNAGGQVSTVVGLGLNLQGFVKLGSDFGVGLDIYESVNPVQNMFAIRFGLSVTNAK